MLDDLFKRPQQSVERMLNRMLKPFKQAFMKPYRHHTYDIFSNLLLFNL